MTPKIVEYKGKYGVKELKEVTIPAVYSTPTEAADEWAMYERAAGKNPKLIESVCKKMLEDFK